MNTLNQIETINTTVGNHVMANMTPSYGLAGNMTGGGASKTFEWDAANRLVAINRLDSGARTEFGYRPPGLPPQF